MNLREKMFLIQTVFKSHFSNEPFYKLYFKLLTQLCYWSHYLEMIASYLSFNDLPFPQHGEFYFNNPGQVQ